MEPLHLEGAVKLLMHASAVAHAKRISKPMYGSKDQGYTHGAACLNLDCGSLDLEGGAHKRAVVIAVFLHESLCAV